MPSTRLFPAPLLLACVGLMFPTLAPAQAPEFRSDRQFAEHYGWIYNDLPAGIAEAQRTGRPIMVVIRCPP